MELILNRRHTFSAINLVFNKKLCSYLLVLKFFVHVYWLLCNHSNYAKIVVPVGLIYRCGLLFYFCNDSSGKFRCVDKVSLFRCSFLSHPSLSHLFSGDQVFYLGFHLWRILFDQGMFYRWRSKLNFGTKVSALCCRTKYYPFVSRQQIFIVHSSYPFNMTCWFRWG